MRFDEFEIGRKTITPSIVVTLDDIVDFAQKYDPHYFHVDETRAKSSLFNGIVASGMHSLALINAEWVRMGELGEDIQGGVSCESTWSRPIYPRDKIYGVYTVVEKKLNSNGRYGLITFDMEGFKNEDELFSKSRLKILIRV